VAEDPNKPLATKLGLLPGLTLALDGAPRDIAAILGPLPPGAKTGKFGRNSKLVLAFVTTSARLAAVVHAAPEKLAPDGALWIAWPKKASKVPTDVTEDVVRAHALPLGLVDNKVCAIDATWSGLRLVVRKERRSGWGT